MKSMTSFSSIEDKFENYSLSFFLKSYNSRYFELSVLLPYGFDKIEYEIRKKIKERYSSGKLEFKILANKQDKENKNDNEFLSAYKELEFLAKSINKYIETESIFNKNVIGINNITSIMNYLKLTKKKPENNFVFNDELKDLLFKNMDSIFLDFDKNKKEEGFILKKDLENNLQNIKISFDKIIEYEKDIEKELKNNFLSRLKEFENEFKLDKKEENFSNQFAFFMMKYTINEELVRFKSHIKAIEKLIQEEDKIGKQIDFYCQELNREINTIGSKNMLLDTTSYIVKIKNCIENIREQVKNIE